MFRIPTDHVKILLATNGRIIHRRSAPKNEVTDFSNTLKAITITKHLLNLSGIWPLEIRDILFISFIIYGCVYNILGLLDLIKYIKNSHYVIANLMENILLVMTMIKLLMIRIKYRALSRFLIETEIDYTNDNYENDEERLIFLKYNKFSYRYVVILFFLSTFLLLLYYFKSIVPNILMVMANSTSEYKLPYKIQPLLKPYNARNYAFDCIHEFIRIIMVVSAYVGPDCLLGCTSFHLSGQLAILKCRVKEISKNNDGSRERIRKIILRHQHLIRLADILEDSFNIVISQHLFGITIQLCVSSYRMLSENV
ncbi:odorant receptor 13a-like [Vespa velutina]|uniref:odorant receptor 13a-like n=1 Tax=Vespa velutina TaxID=202808 RepID=UPI001FB30A97|nr:odorant receptor 13a-like [Vespa velutina]